MNWYVSKTLCVRQFEWLEYMAFHHIAIAYYGFLPHVKGVLGVRVGSLDREVLGVLVGASACTFASCKFGFWCHGVLIGCFFGPVLLWDLQTKSVAAHLGHKAKPLLVELALMVTWKVCKRVCQFHEKRRHLLSAADNHKISKMMCDNASNTVLSGSWIQFFLSVLFWPQPDTIETDIC